MQPAHTSLESPLKSELNDVLFQFLGFLLIANERVKNAILPVLLHLARSLQKVMSVLI